MNKELMDCVVGLTRDPFDHALRRHYVELLVEAEQYSSAVEQLQLLIKHDPETSGYADQLRALESQLEKVHCRPSVVPISSRAQLLHEAGPAATGLSDRTNVTRLSSAGKVRFADIAGMDEVKKNIRRRIIDPFVNPGLFAKFKRKSGGGVLLYGPPGCGKTMIAKAIATECKASFHAVGISDVLNMFIGESESNLASVFDRARSEKPAVLFFDELDALAYSRSKAHSDHTRTLVNEFLNQLDGVADNNEGVLILGATNMPWDVDDAMKRNGRFERQLFVPPPDTEAKSEMLRMKLIDVPCDQLQFDLLAAQCEHFSGADIDELIQRAKDNALDEMMETGAERNLNDADFRNALADVNASTRDWLKTARNLVKFGNAGGSYREVETYLRQVKLY